MSSDRKVKSAPTAGDAPAEQDVMTAMFRQRATAGDGAFAMAYAIMQLAEATLLLAFEQSRQADAMEVIEPVECNCPACRARRGQRAHDA